MMAMRERCGQTDWTGKRRENAPVRFRVDHFSGPLHPRATQPNDVDPYTVKSISPPKPSSDATDVFLQQVCQSRNGRTRLHKDWLTTKRASPFPPRSPCDIVAGRPHGV